MSQPLPDALASLLAQLLAEGQEAEVGELLASAAKLDDQRLAAFLDGLSDRVMGSSEPITAAEVAELLAAARPPG